MRATMEGRFLKAICVSMVIVGICDCFVMDGGSAASTQSNHAEIEHLKSLVDVMQRDLSAKNNTIQFLQSADALLEQRIRDLESKVRTLQGTTSETTSDVGTLQQITSILQSDISSAKQQLSAMSTNLANIQQHGTTMSKPENHLHFTATSPPQTVPSSTWDALKFKYVESSSPDSGFNTSTGVFTAPWNGTYLFSLSLGVTSSVNGIGCYIAKYNTPLERHYIGQARVGIQGWLMASTQVPVSLAAGDHIEVSACGGSGELYIGSKFSGVFLYPE